MSNKPAARAGALAAENKGYVPDGLTRAQWEAIQAEEAAKKAQKKPRKDKVEVRQLASPLMVVGCGLVWFGRVGPSSSQ